MFCKLCGTHLYERITFNNLFKFNYFLHEECEKKINKSSDYIAFPFLDKLILRDYLFEEISEKSDTDFLFQKYSILFYKRMLESNEWSVVIFVDKKVEYNTMILITKLADKAILFCSIFNENFL